MSKLSEQIGKLSVRVLTELTALRQDSTVILARVKEGMADVGKAQEATKELHEDVKELALDTARIAESMELDTRLGEAIVEIQGMLHEVKKAQELTGKSVYFANELAIKKEILEAVIKKLKSFETVEMD